MIGIIDPDHKTVEEVFQLLKIPWEPYVAGRQYDALIVRKGEVPEVQYSVIDLSSTDIFEKIGKLLNRGQEHLSAPLCDIELDNLRKNLIKKTVLVEIPPVPWNYAYMVALTHDVDVISARQSSLRSVFFAAVSCCLQLRFREGGAILLAKFRLANDPWNLFNRWMEIETSMDARSTFFFVPFKNNAGRMSHPYRAVQYELDQPFIDMLIAGGWEAGVHGIDNWIDADKGTKELYAISKKNAGNRTHWLLFNQNSWYLLDRAGYSYDSTFGYNDDIGFRAGTLQVYQPQGVSNILEIPMHIQDIALFGKQCWAPSDKGWVKTRCLNLSEPVAIERCNRIFDYAKKYGGVVTILWHYENLTPPRDWSKAYLSLLMRAKHDKAWITTASNIVGWFQARRNTKISCFRKDKTITIHLSGYNPTMSPPLTVRVHVEPVQVTHIDGECTAGDQYIDIKGDRPVITVFLR